MEVRVLSRSRERRMADDFARRVVIALVLGIVLGMIVGDSAVGIALGVALVFGAGLFAAKQQ
jgi:L-cystine uptake protein TcyP (sodium:dicarboxylate symporter family)